MRIGRPRSFAVAVAGIVVAGIAVLTACGPYAPRSLPLGVDDDSIAGTWRSSDGAELVFSGDGTLVYTSLPAALPSTSGFDSGCGDDLAEATDRVDGSGTWSRESSDPIVVDVDDDRLTLHPTGFLSFTSLDYLCDVDGVGAYSFERED